MRGLLKLWIALGGLSGRIASRVITVIVLNRAFYKLSLRNFRAINCTFYDTFREERPLIEGHDGRLICWARLAQSGGGIKATGAISRQINGKQSGCREY